MSSARIRRRSHARRSAVLHKPSDTGYPRVHQVGPEQFSHSSFSLPTRRSPNHGHEP